MSSDAHDPGAELERFRAYVRLLARLGLGPRLQGKVDLSGVVQQTLLETFQAWEQFHGLSEKAKTAWLRKAVARNLKDEIAKLRTGKRDIERERSLDAELKSSSARVEAWLASDDDSPSQIASLHENQVRLAWALEQLSEARRMAVELHSLQGFTLEETAKVMGKTKDAVAQDYRRGIQDLHKLLDHE